MHYTLYDCFYFLWLMLSLVHLYFNHKLQTNQNMRYTTSIVYMINILFHDVCWPIMVWQPNNLFILHLLLWVLHDLQKLPLGTVCLLLFIYHHSHQATTNLFLLLQTAHFKIHTVLEFEGDNVHQVVILENTSGRIVAIDKRDDSVIAKVHCTVAYLWYNCHNDMTDFYFS